MVEQSKLSKEVMAFPGLVSLEKDPGDNGQAALRLCCGGQGASRAAKHRLSNKLPLFTGSVHPVFLIIPVAPSL